MEPGARLTLTMSPRRAANFATINNRKARGLNAKWVVTAVSAQQSLAPPFISQDAKA
jgi:hypothetical protein